MAREVLAAAGGAWYLGPMRWNTLAVHAGDGIDPVTGALDGPLVHSSAFAFETAADAAAQFAGEREGFIYGRWRNPTTEAFEAKVAKLEGADAAVATASGMAAIFGALAAHLEAGGHVLAPRGIYAETAKLLRTHFERFGVRFDFVDMTDLAAVEAALGADTRVVWCETPANPTLAVYDIAALAERARSVGAALVVDSTFATPYHQHPLELGADLVVHSATKGIGGHGDALGGVAVGSREKVDAVRSVAVRAAGGVLAPHNAWMLSRGLRTLGLRMERSSANAQELAQRLEADERIARVFYPGLASHPQHSVAARQMKRGFGALVAFELVGGLPADRRAYDAFEVLTRAVSLGDLRTLVSHPASTTHFSMPAAQRAAAGISDGLFRMSVGVEDVEDLWEDLDRAMGAAARP